MRNLPLWIRVRTIGDYCAFAVCLVAISLAGFCGHELVFATLHANLYPFGAEGPVAGRWAYRSQQTYLFDTAVVGGLYLANAVASLHWRRIGWVTLILAVLCLPWIPLALSERMIAPTIYPLLGEPDLAVLILRMTRL